MSAYHQTEIINLIKQDRSCKDRAFLFSFPSACPLFETQFVFRLESAYDYVDS